MNSNGFWTSPADRIVRGSMGHCNLTVLQAPYDVDGRALPANDPVRAAEFAASCDTVEEILEDLGARSALETPYPDRRSDLDVVQAGAWGHVLGICDPAFADNGNDTPLLHGAKVLRERFPDARVVGRVHFHAGADHTEDLVWLPDGAMFHASGWPGDEPFVVSGDPDAVIASLGLTGETLEGAGLYLDEDEPNETEWSALATLALGQADPWNRPDVQTSAFRVRHTESAVRAMEHLYFI
ncbi:MULTISPECIES: DUF6333 family protein [Streptomyces]|uniref:DUF6333 family protein n=1 Tax=Streptomyces TaxID=1883 RepID=UPI001317ED55|nr:MULTISPECIES: DUF6333 family protein [Streptomyces]QGZ50821.1 hypothetical protein GPZ77_22755 [Streptomyces sp. QHH-9511]GGT82339.1 hypothetical protein GCM10010272_28600 [Streptomyces lateritius]